MKKVWKGIGATALAVGMIFPTACGGEVVQKIDKNKTQLYISVYNGGVGTKWISDLAKEWNKTNEKYEVIISPEKSGTANIISNIAAGGAGTGTNPIAYFTGESGMQELIYGGKLEDLSDLLTRELDGEGNGTLKEKIGNDDSYYESVWQNVAGKYNPQTKAYEGTYLLPYCDNFGGLIFDYDTFREKDWLFKADPTNAETLSALSAQGIEYEISGSEILFKSYNGNGRCSYDAEDDNVIFTAGKDGKFGTWDDGQPQTVSEWETMINKIVYVSGAKAFIWTGTYNGYVDMVFEGMMAHYAGLDEYNTYFTFDGDVTIDGVKTTVTPDTGYQVYSMDAYEKALDFLHEYFYKNKVSINGNSFESTSHTDAQSLYVLGYRNESSAPTTAMLVDGEWFENEASAILKNDKQVAADGYGYGAREYRMMGLPMLEGAHGLDGNGSGSVFSVLNSGAILIPKQKNAEKLAQVKDFICYTLTEENLQRFTVQTGVTNGYRYELTDEQYYSLTGFGRCINDIYNDENVNLARGQLMYQSSPMRFATTAGFFRQKYPAYAGSQYGCMMAAFEDGKKPNDIATGSASFYKHANNSNGASATTWEALLAEARKSGFYAN